MSIIAHRLMKILKRVDPETEVFVSVNKKEEHEIVDIGRWTDKHDSRKKMRLAINIEKEEPNNDTTDRKDQTEN